MVDSYVPKALQCKTTLGCNIDFQLFMYDINLNKHFMLNFDE